MRRILRGALASLRAAISWLGRMALAARRSWRAGLAIALIVVPVVLGIWILSQRSPARVEPASVGFVPPVAATPGRGFTVGLVARVRSCGEPLDVTVVAAGTAEFWLDKARAVPRAAKFRFAIPGVVGNDVDVWAGTTATDVVDPDTTRLRRNDPARIARQDLELESVRRDGDLTVVRGTIRNWSRTLVPIVADFRADWLEDRSLGTCFVHLPAIAGDLSILSAQRALGKAGKVGEFFVRPDELTVDSRRLGVVARYRPGLEVTYGSATVRVENGSIDTNDSLPQPSESVNGNPTWTCRGRARSTKRLVPRSSGGPKPAGDYVLLGSDPRGSAGALSTAALRAGPAGDCSAVVVAVEASAPWKRDLVLLLTGAVISLGVTLLVEMAIAPRRRRRRSDGELRAAD
jgi:hypothetical protein